LKGIGINRFKQLFKTKAGIAEKEVINIFVSSGNYLHIKNEGHGQVQLFRKKKNYIRNYYHRRIKTYK